LTKFPHLPIAWARTKYGEPKSARSRKSIFFTLAKKYAVITAAINPP